MISHLHGTIARGMPGDVSVDVGGVGYRVAVPLPVWEQLTDGSTARLWITTYVREDRFDLFGFLDVKMRALFEHCITIAGIGPKTGLELCSVPRAILARAALDGDGKELTSVRGIGRKTAEKLALELKSIAEKHPELFVDAGAAVLGQRDPDAVAVLAQLGYTTADILRALDQLPRELRTTEERVTAALKQL
ncbi:MAG: Holliday junction DNA helicase subunit RuvA [Candidatus Peregrinibacteria bacterium Gr01-1014_25]|nr:MAG: Holliday junction DNA helicase subunit RuvA [Candidatus Peregrinibacteria bacterium Gr01-1014_25]